MARYTLNLREVLLIRFPSVLTFLIEQLPFGKLLMLPTYATDIVEV